MAKLVGVVSMLAIVVVLQVSGASANTIMQSVIQFTAPAFAPTTPTSTAEYLRIELGNTVANKAFDATTLDLTASKATISRKRGVVVTTIPVPIALDVRSMQPRISNSVVNPPGGTIVPRPGFIDFGKTVPNTNPATMQKQPLAPAVTFLPGDKVTIKLVFKGDVPFVASLGLFKDGDGGTGVNSPVAGGQFKIPGATAKFDPEYTVTNDLDLTAFPGNAPFIIQNLGFLSNLTEAQFDALDLSAILAGDLPPGALTVGSFELESANASSASFPFSKLFTDPFSEPGSALYDVAFGQLVDPDTGTLSAFIHGYQGIPLPPSAWLFASALSLFFLGRGVHTRRAALKRHT